MRKGALFLIGFICGVLALGAVLILKNFAQGLASWGATQVSSDMEVRRSIKNSGIALPPESWDLFYATSGFQDTAEWITFTVPHDKLWSVVEASIHKKREAFAVGIPTNFPDKVERLKDQTFDASLWTPKSSKNPLHLSLEQSGSYFEDWVVDEENGRVFILKQHT